MTEEKLKEELARDAKRFYKTLGELAPLDRCDEMQIAMIKVHIGVLMADAINTYRGCLPAIHNASEIFK